MNWALDLNTPDLTFDLNIDHFGSHAIFFSSLLLI